jgi:hypothetical protein
MLNMSGECGSPAEVSARAGVHAEFHRFGGLNIESIYHTARPIQTLSVVQVMSQSIYLAILIERE